MNVSDRELFKKSKIIEIGSVKKSYGFAKLEVFGNFPGFPGFSYLDFSIFSGFCLEEVKTLKNYQKFL